MSCGGPFLCEGLFGKVSAETSLENKPWHFLLGFVLYKMGFFKGVAYFYF